MKILKTVIPLLAVMLSVCLTACSNDDDNVIVSNPTFVLSEIQSGQNTAKLNYDNNGRFVDADLETNSYHDLDFGYLDSHFTYEGNTIKFADPDIMTFILKDGLINSWKTEEGNIIYSYNGSKELNTMSIGGEVLSEYLWEDGLLIAGGEVDYDCSLVYYDDSRINEDAMNALNSLIIYEYLEDEYPWVLAMRGYLGKLPNKPIKSVSIDFSDYDIIYGNIDENGCPGSITMGREEYLLKWRKL